MKYEDSIRILLAGTCGANFSKIIASGCNVHRRTLGQLMSGDDVSERSLEKIGMFVWQRVNAHVLIAECDKEP